MIGNNSVLGMDQETVYSAGQGGYIATWDGMQWKAAKVDAVTGREFLSVWATPAADIWGLGKTGMASRGDGTSWTSDGPVALATFDLRGVWGGRQGRLCLSLRGGQGRSPRLQVLAASRRAPLSDSVPRLLVRIPALTRHPESDPAARPG